MPEGWRDSFIDHGMSRSTLGPTIRAIPVVLSAIVALLPPRFDGNVVAKTPSASLPGLPMVSTFESEVDPSATAFKLDVSPSRVTVSVRFAF